MLWVIAIPAVGLWWLWGDIWKYADSPMAYFAGLGMAVILGLFAFMIGLGIAFFVGSLFPKVWSEPKVTHLVSLRNTHGIVGSSFLGTGQIGSEEFYFYHSEMNGGYVPGKCTTDGVVIYEDGDNMTGILKEYSREFRFTVCFLFGLPAMSLRREFYIPKGSLIQNFRIE
ncbi:MAG: hypothetical protein U1A25_01430 [Candidatus Sungbacteria bacterium]|nr:hypothetical protein [bacterium]MDZ4260302.1 hypothetical protein [Candidatus Sungbacteria bacterium]